MEPNADLFIPSRGSASAGHHLDGGSAEIAQRGGGTGSDEVGVEAARQSESKADMELKENESDADRTSTVCRRNE